MRQDNRLEDSQVVLDIRQLDNLRLDKDQLNPMEHHTG